MKVGNIESNSLMQYSDTRFKNGLINFDLTSANGTVAVTGTGFTPKAVILMCAMPGYSFSQGYMITSAMRGSGLSGTTPTYTNNGTNFSVTDGTNSQEFTFSAFGADGFTLANVKTNSPTGTAVINWIALR